MRIEIRKKTDLEKVISSIFYVIYSEGIISIFFPSIHPLYYLVDIINIFLLLSIMKSNKLLNIINSPLKWFIRFFFMFLVISLLGIIINFSNPILHMWGFRTWFSGFIFFIACVAYVNSDDIKFVNKLFGLNFFVSIIEIIAGYRQDSFGGIYGVATGKVNGPLNLLLIIILTKTIIDFINGKMKKLNILFILCSLIMIAAFAELKIFFIEVTVIIILSCFVTKFSIRKLLIVMVGIIAMLIGIKLLFIVFPSIDGQMFSVKYMWRYLTNKGGYVGQFAHNAGDINRLAFWDKCVNLFDNKLEFFIGKGLGNCDQVEAMGIESNFYKNYHVLHYYMFPLPMLLLQQGIVGMMLFIAMFVSVFGAVLKQKKMCNMDNNEKISMIQTVEVISLMTFIIIIYDSSLLGKGGYLLFYVLALPFVEKNKRRSNN